MKKIHHRLSRLISSLLGKRYYAVAIRVAGTGEVELASAIHSTLAEAMAHAARIREGRSFTVAGIVTFRSHISL